MELCQEDVVRMIKMYELHRCLWDREHKWYYKRKRKYGAWKAIAQAMGVAFEDAKQKMLSVLGSFRREKAKYIKAVGAGDPEYESDWFAFKSFGFLLHVDNPRAIIKWSTVRNEMNWKRPIEEYLEIEQDLDSNTSIKQSAGTDSDDSTIPEAFQPKRRRALSKTDIKIEKVYPEPEVIISSSFIQKTQDQGDPTFKYAEYLAAKLNQFDPKTKSLLIHKINTLIFETEMSALSYK